LRQYVATGLSSANIPEWKKALSFQGGYGAIGQSAAASAIGFKRAWLKSKRHCRYFKQSRIGVRLGRNLVLSDDRAASQGGRVNAIRLATTVACSLLVPGTAFSVQAAELTFRCVNQASHASWALTVDPAKSMADGFPATISAARIAWHDTVRGGNYELDRASGALTFSNASSRGGYMLFHRCQQVK
jgi:hypothetical protein